MYAVKDLFGGTSARALPQPGKGLWRTTHNLGACALGLTFSPPLDTESSPTSASPSPSHPCV